MQTAPFDIDATIRALAAGQRVLGHRYTLVRVLGRGGMGVVWLARDETLKHEVALKFLPEAVIHDASAVHELKQETQRSLKLTHPQHRAHPWLY
jgi:serine/threonine protein kinase